MKAAAMRARVARAYPDPSEGHLDHLTARQQAVFDALCQFFVDKGRLPTVRELGQAAGFASTSTVYQHLLALKRKGLLRPGRHLALRPVGMRLLLNTLVTHLEPPPHQDGHLR